MFTPVIVIPQGGKFEGKLITKEGKEVVFLSVETPEMLTNDDGSQTIPTPDSMRTVIDFNIFPMAMGLQLMTKEPSQTLLDYAKQRAYKPDAP